MAGTLSASSSLSGGPGVPHACSDWGGLGDSDSINVEGKAPEGQQAEENITRKGRGTYLLRFDIVIFPVYIQLKPLRQQGQAESFSDIQFRLFKG